MITNDTLFTGDRFHTVHLTNKNTGAGDNETGVVKVDLSSLPLQEGVAAVSVSLVEARWSVGGYNYVAIDWDHTTDDAIIVCPTGADYATFEETGGKHDPRSAGGTGNVLLTTIGTDVGSSYDITLKFKIKYN